jgi:hypothetical protein
MRAMVTRALCVLALVVLATAAKAQQTTYICIGPASSPCSLLGPSNPLPITGTTTPAATTPAITFQGRITLTAATNTTLTNANVTMDLGSLPTAGAFKNLTLIPPTSCTVNVRFDGTAATATTGEQMGSGTNVGTDTWNLTGQTNAPTLYSTAGCTNIVFRG